MTYVVVWTVCCLKQVLQQSVSESCRATCILWCMSVPIYNTSVYRNICMCMYAAYIQVVKVFMHQYHQDRFLCLSSHGKTSNLTGRLCVADVPKPLLAVRRYTGPFLSLHSHIIHRPQHVTLRCIDQKPELSPPADILFPISFPHNVSWERKTNLPCCCFPPTIIMKMTMNEEALFTLHFLKELYRQ